MSQIAQNDRRDTDDERDRVLVERIERRTMPLAEFQEHRALHRVGGAPSIDGASTTELRTDLQRRIDRANRCAEHAQTFERWTAMAGRPHLLDVGKRHARERRRR
jgi:hypothetical protein